MSSSRPSRRTYRTSSLRSRAGRKRVALWPFEGGHLLYESFSILFRESAMFNTTSLYRRIKAARKSTLLLFFLGPTLTLVFFFYFLPVVFTVLLSMTDMNETFDWHFIGPANFMKIILGGDPRVVRIITNTAIYMVLALILTVSGGLIIALLTTHMKEGAGIFFRAVWLLPNLTPPVVYILLWKWFFDPTHYGFLNSVLGAFDVSSQPWLIRYALPIVIPVNAFIGLSFCMVTFTSAIKSIPTDITYAAKVDGATTWQVIRYVTLPLLKWPIMFMTAWHVIAHLNSYVYTLLLTDGGPYYRSEVWALYALHKSFDYHEFGYGAALAMLLVCVSVILTLAVWKIFGFTRLMEPSRIEV
jgi:inositol-phosphate transport system permease protein